MDIHEKFDELLLSRDQKIGQYGVELANVRAELEANKSELMAIRSRLAEAENERARGKGRADEPRSVTAASLIDVNEGPGMQATEADLVSLRSVWSKTTRVHRNEG